MVMCSTCSGFVFRKKRRAMDPDEEVVEVVKEAQKMRDLMQEVAVRGHFQQKEPAEATKEQWRVLRTRRLIMMETKRCPACSHSLPNACPTCSRLLSEKPDEEDEAMVANARSVKKSKRSRKEGKRSSSGLKKKKKAKKSEDKEDGGSEKKAKRSSETEGSGSKEAEMEDVEWGEEEEMEDSELMGENVKTKMVTRRLYKKSIDVLKSRPPIKPFTCDTDDPSIRCTFARDIAEYEVECEFHEYLRRQYVIRGYAEFQQEVTDDEDE